MIDLTRLIIKKGDLVQCVARESLIPGYRVSTAYTEGLQFEVSKVEFLANDDGGLEHLVYDTSDNVYYTRELIIVDKKSDELTIIEKNKESLTRILNDIYGEENWDIVPYSNTIVSEGEFVEGLEEGPWIYNLNDHKEEGKYVSGRREGEWKHFYYDGTVRFNGKYESGSAEGKHTYYYDNGGKMLEGKYEYGLKDGTWTRYNTDGTALVRIQYRDGKEFKIDGAKGKPSVD